MIAGLRRGAPWAVWVLAAALAAGAAGCAGARRKRAESEKLLTAGASYHAAQDEIGKRNFRKARQLLERIRFGAEERGMEPLVKLALADATFYAGDDLSLIEARAKYLDFVTFYGDHPKAPYAQFQAGICSLRQVHDPSRDQSQTLIAIADLAEVDRRYPTSVYAPAARDKVAEARQNLAEHEFLVGRFYLKRKAWLPATERFRGILETYPRYSEKEKVYFHLGQALVRGKNEAEGRVYLEKLLADYPRSEYAEQAREILSGMAKVSAGNGTGS